MSKCIFCKSTNANFTTREHILPESLGGGEWSILPHGLLCDACQNRFGSSIEQQALADYPFSFLRVFLGIPTKKKKAPWFKSWEGIIRARLQPGKFDYYPLPVFEKSIEMGQKSQIRLLAHPMRPHMVCRFILKMAIEVIAADNLEDVFNEKFDPARDFALLGTKEDDWWYLQLEDTMVANNYMINGITAQDWSEGVKLEVVEINGGAEVFHLKFLYLDIFSPLESRIKPPLKESLSPPEQRLFLV